MSGEASYKMDFSDFNRKFLTHAVKTCPAAAEKGMFEAISALKNDADSVVPKTPHDQGNLRGDYDIIIKGITQSTVMSKSEGKGTQHFKSGEAPAERFGAENIIAQLVFRMPYAAKWHEAVGRKINWSESGVGPKFLESKMMMFNPKYMSIVAWEIAAVNSGSPVSAIQWNPTGDEGMGDDNPRF